VRQAQVHPVQERRAQERHHLGIGAFAVVLAEASIVAVGQTRTVLVLLQALPEALLQSPVEAPVEALPEAPAAIPVARQIAAEQAVVQESVAAPAPIVAHAQQVQRHSLAELRRYHRRVRHHQV